MSAFPPFSTGEPIQWQVRVWSGHQGVTDQSDRNNQMLAAYRAGDTMEQIGAAWGVTRERVRQILHTKFGVTYKTDSPRWAQNRERKRAAERARDARYMRRHGCSFAEFNSIPSAARRAYREQRRNSFDRKIGWHFTLLSWWQMWLQSGHWAERGRGYGYGMYRLDSSGPYEASNTVIAPHSDFMRDHVWAAK